MSKPPPFKRPSIDMDRHGRVWKRIEAKDLKKGDVISERGLVSWAWPYHDDAADVHEVHVGMVSGDVDNYDIDEIVFAFVRRES